MRLSNHKKGNSISTTTPSSTAMPTSARSTPMPGSTGGHRRNHSAAPNIIAGVRKILPTNMFKPAPAPLEPFFGSHEDDYLADVPGSVPLAFPPRAVPDRDPLGRLRKEPIKHETLPARRPQRPTQPAPSSATVSGHRTSAAKRENLGPPPAAAYRPKHYNHLSDSAAQVLSPGRHRPRRDSPHPATLASQVRKVQPQQEPAPEPEPEPPRTLRKAGHLDAPFPKPKARPPTGYNSIYMTPGKDYAWDSILAMDSKRPAMWPIHVLNAHEPDIFKHVYASHVRMGDSKKGDWKYWRRFILNEYKCMPDGTHELDMSIFIPDEIREAVEESLQAHRDAIENKHEKLPRPIPAHPLGVDGYYGNNGINWAPLPSSGLEPAPLPLYVAQPTWPTANPVPSAKPPPTTGLPPGPSRSKQRTCARKPGMYWTGKYREGGFEVPPHVEHSHELLPRHLRDMTPEELDVLYDILKEQIITDCFGWLAKQHDDRNADRATNDTYNRALQNAIDHNPGVSVRHCQRLALDRLIYAVEDLRYDDHKITMANKAYKPIYQELLFEAEEKKIGKRKEVRRGNLARTAVAVPPGTKPPPERSTRPTSHF